MRDDEGAGAHGGAMVWPVQSDAFCAVGRCQSWAAWQQPVVIGDDQQEWAWLTLCAYHSWQLQDKDTEEDARRCHYRCPECGGPLQAVTLLLNPQTQLYGGGYECTASCTSKQWSADVMYASTVDRLRAAWEAEQVVHAAWEAQQPADEED